MKSDSFTSSTAIRVSFISFSCLAAQARTFHTIRNRTSESRHPFRFPNLRRVAFSFSPVRTTNWHRELYSIVPTNNGKESEKEHIFIYMYINILGDFPGGAVVKNLPANAGNMGSIPGPGRSHMPRSN